MVTFILIGAALVYFEWHLLGALTIVTIGYLVLVGLFTLCTSLAILLSCGADGRVRRLFRESEGKGEFVRRRLLISPEGLATATEHIDESLRWPAIEKIVPAAEHVFFYTSPTAAIIVPKHAFPDEGRFSEFVELARRYHEQSRAATEPPPA
jgi:hypothetical protein